MNQVNEGANLFHTKRSCSRATHRTVFEDNCIVKGYKVNYVDNRGRRKGEEESLLKSRG